MKLIVYRSEDRGIVNHGWLQAKHSFSFGNYYHPSKVNFGALRVLNDDTIASGMGFGTHPHDNMEIITIPLEGKLKHKDSMGHQSEIPAGEIQVMSAGTGIMHSEFNGSASDDLKLFQIWIFPNKQNVEPRYQQLSLEPLLQANKFEQILSPNPEDKGVWIHQDAYIHLGTFHTLTNVEYTLKNPANGLYAMVINGTIEIDSTTLHTRDAVGITHAVEVKIRIVEENTQVLLIEVPMEF